MYLLTNTYNCNRDFNDLNLLISYLDCKISNHVVLYACVS